jgi:hypothetical protein
MKSYKNILIIVFAISFFSAKADSPITSTPFYKAYAENSYVQLAQKSKVLNDSIAAYLLSDTVSVDKKAAVINALGWDFDKKTNAKLFFTYIQKKYKFEKAFDLNALSSDDIFCLGYLTIMDNYFETEKPIKLLTIAKNKNPKSYTVNIVLALAEAQKAMDSDWCRVWKLGNEIFTNEKLVKDLNDEAIKTIQDYLMLYKSSCK